MLGDWYLPNMIELHSLVDPHSNQLMIDTTAFPGTATAWFLSSTTNGGSPRWIWIASHNAAADGVFANFKSIGRALRCVRLLP